MPLITVLYALWAVQLAGALLLIVWQRTRIAGAALLVTWLAWSAVGAIPCAHQQLSLRARHRSLTFCPMVPLGPLALYRYQR